MKLVLIHGRAQGTKTEQLLRDEWIPALLRGIELADIAPLPDDLDVRMPFYGKELDKLVGTLPPGQVVSRGGGGAPNQVQADAEIALEMGSAVIPRGPQNWEWVRAVGRALAKHVPWISEFALDQWLRDVDAYLTRVDVGRAVDDIVRPEILGSPAVVVGHSLGSIVAYNILTGAGNAADVPLFVTVGSPLGIPVVKRYLPRPLGMPAGVKRWFNGSDERDPVALFARLDRDTFPADIENASDIHNARDDPHGIVSYLGDTTVARRVRDALT
jgi:pimeloyl-ACP methyl ester carboxylesterase